MTLKTIAPTAALNKVFLKEPLQQAALQSFKTKLTEFTNQLDATK